MIFFPNFKYLIPLLLMIGVSATYVRTKKVIHDYREILFRLFIVWNITIGIFFKKDMKNFMCYNNGRVLRINRIIDCPIFCCRAVIINHRERGSDYVPFDFHHGVENLLVFFHYISYVHYKIGFLYFNNWLYCFTQAPHRLILLEKSVVALPAFVIYFFVICEFYFHIS